MSQALVGAAEAISPALREGTLLDPNGRPFRYDRPAGATRSIDAYTPDETIYAIDEKASPILKFFEEAEAGRVTVEAHLLLEDGRTTQRVDLSEADVKSAVRENRLGDVAKGVQLRERANAIAALEDGDDVEVLREDDLGGDDGSGEFLPLGNGPFNQQLYLHDQWDMLAKSFWAATHDPVGKAGLEIIVDFVLGRGFTVVAKDPLVQEEWDRFWKLNRGNERMHTWLLDWFRDGENFTRFFRQQTRPPRIAMLEPSTILEIITDPENIDDVKLYWQQYQTAFQMYTSGEAESSKYIIRQIPAEEVLHSKINASSSEKRGRSDLFPVLGWLKRLRDYYNAETLKAIIQAAFSWDFTIKGSGVDVGTVNAYANETPPPDLAKPGQGFYHNDAVEVKALQADKAATNTGSIGIGDGLLGIIAIGLKIAKDYLGVTSRGSRATALVAETPAVKHFETRQKVVRHWVERMAEKVVAIAIEENRLPRTVIRASDDATVKAIIAKLRAGDIAAAFKALAAIVRGGVTVPLDPTVEVSFPDIVKADRTATIADVERAESNQYISKRRARQMVANSFDLTDFDPDEEAAEIAEEPPGTMIARTGQQVEKGAPRSSDPAFNPSEVPNPAAAASSADDNPAGAGAAKIRTDFRAGEQRKTISFVIGD